MTLGVDLFEKYNLVTDWQRVAADGVRFCYLKTTNGTAVANPPADTYAAAAQRAGITIGGYHYALSGDPRAQATTFAGELLRLNMANRYSLAPALDFEDASLPGDRDMRLGWIGTFLATLKRALSELGLVLLYSSGSELASFGDVTQTSIFIAGLRIEVWDGEYGPNDGREHPIVHYTGTVAVHQYTSVGRLPGITGPVDLDDAPAMEAIQMTNPTTLDSVLPSLVPGSTVQLPVQQFIRNGDMYGYELVTELIPELQHQMDAIQTALAELAATVAHLVPSQLTGSATVTVDLAPPA